MNLMNVHLLLYSIRKNYVTKALPLNIEQQPFAKIINDKSSLQHYILLNKESEKQFELTSKLVEEAGARLLKLFSEYVGHQYQRKTRLF